MNSGVFYFPQAVTVPSYGGAINFSLLLWKWNLEGMRRDV